ncbi:hypothetical protein [Allopusillimonas ginsengisoli]|uniref:hypothetical protein n=1 Tax=Allopusillimonas ginsengisoli TaxID=453575 RepID=UPI0010202A3F|nr:hypothetical protein [Allopusillimonas ginsengisoli]TEA79853.1 hypothetical protein ERE07_02635 [Allopusillimonas ginsengisoli]
MDHYLPGATNIYKDGPFIGRPKIAPYRTVLSRLTSMGVTIPEKQAMENDRQYVERLNAVYREIFNDILAENSFTD